MKDKSSFPEHKKPGWFASLVFSCDKVRDYVYSLIGFLSTERMAQPTTAPTRMATRYMTGLPIVGTTKIPPCGARSVQSKAIDRAPAVAEPIKTDGMTRSGSPAANGIAPSVMKES